eukprot:1786529-Pleurochrysis_carterae.AAC.2
MANTERMRQRRLNLQKEEDRGIRRSTLLIDVFPVFAALGLTLWIEGFLQSNQRQAFVYEHTNSLRQFVTEEGSRQ